jgi:GNAT superfamily N-acetyltransferase
MVVGSYERITLRDAEEADVPALTAIKGAGTEALHRDRLRDAHGPDFRYLALVVNEEVVGYACLVNRRPGSWSDANDTRHLPQIVDLQVKESHRGQGYGTRFMQALEHTAAAANHCYLYVSVDPVHNPRAFTLYEQLGYQPLQSQPYRQGWAFTDSTGVTHQGEGWAIDMVKQLQP